MVVGMAYVSPQRVLRAASPFLRWQFWLTLLLCIGAASSSLAARTDTGGSPITQWWTLIPLAMSFAAIFINAGMVWQQLNETKRRVEEHDKDIARLRQDTDNTFARKDVIVEQLKALHAEIAGLRELLAK